MSDVDEPPQGVKLITVEVNGETRIAAIDCTGDKVQCECGKTFRAFDKGGCTAHVRSNAHPGENLSRDPNVNLVQPVLFNF